MIDKKQIIDIQDFANEFHHIVELSKPIQSNFQAIVLDYKNKISNKLGNSPITDTRTNILFRIQSIFYFVELMEKEEALVLKYINDDNQLDKINKIRLSDELILKQTSIFDTILYHLSSLYDYFSYMSGYLYNGKGLNLSTLIILAQEHIQLK